MGSQRGLSAVSPPPLWSKVTPAPPGHGLKGEGESQPRRVPARAPFQNAGPAQSKPFRDSTIPSLCSRCSLPCVPPARPCPGTALGAPSPSRTLLPTGMSRGTRGKGMKPVPVLLERTRSQPPGLNEEKGAWLDPRSVQTPLPEGCPGRNRAHPGSSLLIPGLRWSLGIAPALPRLPPEPQSISQMGQELKCQAKELIQHGGRGEGKKFK